MRAMILAAGRGRRLGALTQIMPKPMILVNRKPLIVYALESLQRAGIHYCVININHLGFRIRDYLKGGEQWGLRVFYSEERHILETGGGIRRALPLLDGHRPFLVMNADLLHDLDLRSFLLRNARRSSLAHLVLRPSAARRGDFSLRRGRVVAGSDCVFCGISILHPQLFLRTRSRSFRLADILNTAIRNGAVSGEFHPGYCFDLGTQAELAAAQQAIRSLP